MVSFNSIEISFSADRLGLLLVLTLLQPMGPARAEEFPPLIQPSICSAVEPPPAGAPAPFCRIEPSAERPASRDVTLLLTATTSPVEVGGYRIETQNYNGAYLPPVAEARPGDTLRVRLVNALAPAGAHGIIHGPAGPGPTNLHTHGLIVTANNSRQVTPPPKGDGDNVFVSLGRGDSLDYTIFIPTDLPASVLDGEAGAIAHPTGLYWYHSHLHGISGTQVAGGMSGLLSIGARDVNVVAADPARTDELRGRTDVAYLMLRDIQVRSSVDPTSADGNSPAIWEPQFDARWCGDTPAPDPQDRRGYCRSPEDDDKIWLYTINGQRYPTIRIASGRNHLWRVANLSASVTYELEVVPDPPERGDPLTFDLLSVDGVVPAKPVPEPDAVRAEDIPVAASQHTSILLMPAGRADIYVRNDGGSEAERNYVLRTTGLHTGASPEDGDTWPEIRLARIVLEPTPGPAEALPVALNTPRIEQRPVAAAFAGATDEGEPPLPDGCVRDVDPSLLEHRRITFVTGLPGDRMGLSSVIVRPPDLSGPHPIGAFQEDLATRLLRIDFDRYIDPDDGSVNWDGTGLGGSSTEPPKHVCARLSKSGQKQLWELVNQTGELHNFHLHQAKFRLATDEELGQFGIDVSSLPPAPPALTTAGGAGEHVWHDTLPVPHGVRIFIIVNFHAEEQIGRYVFHCHILEHEDAGMMAPIEVVR